MTKAIQKIPDGWSEKKIIDACPLQRGFDLPEQDIVAGIYPIVYSNGIKGTNNIYKVKAPGVVTGRSGTIGKVTYVTKNYWPHNTSLWVTDFKGNSPKFIFYKLQTLNFSKFDSGSGVPTLNRNDVHIEKICIPPLAEQEKIAEILGAWDSAIEKLTALIAAKRLQKKGLMQKLLTARIRLPGFTGEWQKVKLGEIASISKGEQLGRLEMTETGTYPVINGGISKSGLTDSYNREKDTITISEGGNSCGFVAFMKERFWCGGHCYALSNLQTNLHFLFQILKFEESDIMRLRVGSGLPNIQKSSLDSFSLCIPTDISEQKAIADILSKADEEIDLLTRKLDLIQSQKKGLMQQLLTGKIRVKVA